MTVFDGVYATQLCTVPLPATTSPAWVSYGCSGVVDSTGVLFYALGSGSSPAGTWADFQLPTWRRSDAALSRSFVPIPAFHELRCIPPHSTQDGGRS